jgi:cystathionine beta-lyase/cystathionine gamma-synthase
LSSDKPQKPATKIVTAGRSSSLTGPVVNVPVWRASTHLYENVAALEAGKSGNADGRFFYGRRGSPTQWSLAEALTEMEPGAHATMLYPSGVAAIACAVLSVWHCIYSLFDSPLFGSVVATAGNGPSVSASGIGNGSIRWLAIGCSGVHCRSVCT